jgi:hypothetical protein
MDYTKEDLSPETPETREPAVAYDVRGRVAEPWLDYREDDHDAEELEDQYLLALAEERLRNDTGVTYTFEEVLAKHGLTFADLSAMEDVEIE